MLAESAESVGISHSSSFPKPLHPAEAFCIRGTLMNSKKGVKTRVAAVVYGLDEDTKPHAAAFSEKDAEAASKAAIQLKMRIWKPTTDLPGSLQKLPAGMIASPGLAAIPKVPRELFETVLQAATLDNPERKNTVPMINDDDKAAVKHLKNDDRAELERQIIAVAHERQNGRLPEDWASIKKGSVVLVHQNRDDGWWEGLVTNRQGNILTIIWRDYPKQNPVLRHCSAVALMNPRTH